MSPENTAVADKDTPTDEQIADAKPGLSDEEKAALAAEDDASAGKADDAKAGDADNPPQDAADADAADAAGAGSDADADADKAAVADAPPEIPRGAAANVELLPTRNVDMKAAAERLDQIETDQGELDKKFDAEDLDTKDYLSQSRALTQEQAGLEADVREAHFVQNANRSLASTDWQRSVNAFTDNNAEFQSTIMQGALNAALNELYGDEANLGSSHNWYLQTAKRAVLEQISPADAAKANPSDADVNKDAVDAAKSAADKANDAKDKLPKTLGDVPAGDEVGTDKGKFDDLDNLSGVELEAKLALMTPEQEQEYLRAE
jgi:hypothetical protein